jgi:hypothetical protein
MKELTILMTIKKGVRAFSDFRKHADPEAQASRI